MIETGQGSIFDADVEALVNPVNTVGTMGKGLAKEFAERFPEMVEHYHWICERKGMEIGVMHVHKLDEKYKDKGPVRYIINFPTKEHWRDRSRIGWVAMGLVGLMDVLHEFKIKSVAIPALGCGNGGLRWEDVEPLINTVFRHHLLDVRAVVYPPR